MTPEKKEELRNTIHEKSDELTDVINRLNVPGGMVDKEELFTLRDSLLELIDTIRLFDFGNEREFSGGTQVLEAAVERLDGELVRKFGAL